MKTSVNSIIGTHGRRFVLFLGLLAGSLLAQGIRATLVGRITDESGAVIPRAKVKAVNIATNESRQVEAGDTGDFTLPQLGPGEYSLTVEQPGFNTEIRRGILLETGQEARLDVTLRAGGLTQEVNVSAAAPLLSSENATVGNVVDQKKIVELPLNGRDYLQLAQLQPNVYAPAQGSNLGFRGGFNVAGNSEIANQYLLDGVDNNDEATNQPLHRPILDTVREFRVLTGTYSAEFGRQSGGQIIVTTKSGANEFHGTVFEFHRNAPLDARNFFAPQKPSFRRNQFGGVIGGPIRRDQTFFYVGAEGQARGQQEAGLATVPPAALRNGDFSAVSALRDPFNNNAPFAGNQIPQSRWSSQGKGLLDLFPLPNRGGSQNFVSAASGRLNLRQWSTRLDHRFGQKDNLFASYQYADSDEFYPLSNPLCSARDVPGFGCDELQRTQQAVASWTHLFGAALINELRLGYSRFGFYRLQEDREQNVIARLGIGGLPDAGKTPFNNGAPQLSVTGYVVIGGPTNLPQGRHDNNYNIVENLTWVKGPHTLKFGFDGRHVLFNSFFTNFGRGAFVFDGTFTGNAAADLLLGMPRQADRNSGEPFHNAISTISGYYIQDNWKVNPKLTLELGLRYELDLPPTERVDKIASFDPRTGTLLVAGGREAFINPQTNLLEIRSRADVGRRLWQTDYNNFAPRIGLAWRPFGGTGTVVRAGFGTFYNHQIVGNGITPLFRNSPFRQRQTSGPFQSTDRPNLGDAFAGLPSVVAPGIQRDFRSAHVNQWSFGIQREVASNLVLDLTYLGSEGHKLPVGWNINQAFPGPGSVSSRRPFPAFANLVGGYISSIGNSNFHGLSARVERRLSQGLSLLSTFMWSKSIDDNYGVSAAADGSALFAQDARNLRAERSLSDYDVRLRWVLSAVYDLPGKQLQNSAAKAVLRGWQLTGILTLQSGRPFTVFSGRDESNTGGGSDRPNVIGDWRVSPNPDRWFNPCTLLADGRTRRNCGPGDTTAWQLNAVNTFGNAGRNILHGDGLRNFDLGLYRGFRIGERQSIQFRTEVFNLPNHPNLFLPNAQASSSALGSVSRAAFQSQTGAQRQIQFALKFLF